MKIEIFTLCWNEIDILPWVVDYWEKFATHVTVFDNGSTDGSIGFLEHFDWITVVPFESGGFNDTKNQQIKNTCWKGSEADYVVVCDMDELLCAKDIKKSIDRMAECGATICKPIWYELQSEERPVYEYGKMLHEISPLARPFQGFSKAILFNPKAINEINYSPGAHQCNPKGIVKWYDGNDIYALHINHNLSFAYKIERYKVLHSRLSEINKRKRHGIHYGFDEGLLHRAWIEDSKKLVNFNDVING